MCYNGFFYNTKLRCEPAQNTKIILSMNRRLKFICVKAESRVIVDHATVKLLTSEYIPPVSYWNRWGMNMIAVIEFLIKDMF